MTSLSRSCFWATPVAFLTGSLDFWGPIRRARICFQSSGLTCLCFACALWLLKSSPRIRAGGSGASCGLSKVFQGYFTRTKVFSISLVIYRMTKQYHAHHVHGHVCVEMWQVLGYIPWSKRPSIHIHCNNITLETCLPLILALTHLQAIFPKVSTPYPTMRYEIDGAI